MRDIGKVETLAADLRVRGAAGVDTMQLDFTDTAKHDAAMKQVWKTVGAVDVALVCYGDLPDQERTATDFEAAQDTLTVNGLSQISLLTALAKLMTAQQQEITEPRKHVTIAAVTSVAGDRGRQTNYVYGAAKSMVSTYLQGLRGRLLPHGIHIVDIRPGLVDSPMTAHLEKGLLWSSPERVAQVMVRGIARRKHTVYAPGYWRLIMFIVRSIPEFLFKRMKF